MTVVSSDIQFRLSGSVDNSSPVASLGGVKSSVVAGTDIFDNVSATEAGVGRTEYRCVYVHNNNATDAIKNAVAWIFSNTPSTTTDIAIGLGSSTINGTETAVASETTAPANITFVSAADKAGSVQLGTIPAGNSRAIWIRRVVNAGTTAVVSDPFTIRVEGETA